MHKLLCIPSASPSQRSLIFLDRDTFANLVREVASPDVGRMGIEILSFTIKDIFDEVEYLDSLGKTQTAVVKRDADIGVAEAKRDAGIKVSCWFFDDSILKSGDHFNSSQPIYKCIL